MGYFSFFFNTEWTIYGPCNLPYALKKYFKKILYIAFLKRETHFKVILPKIRVLGQKLEGPPPSLFRVNRLN